MAVECGINADFKFLGNTGDFMDFARECGSVLLIDDREWKLLPALRAQNRTQTLISRYHYEGWEGKWRDCPYEGKPQTPQRLFDVVTAEYRPELDVWINIGNEPARHGEELQRDIDWYCELAQICLKNRVKAVFLNIQAVELTPASIVAYMPLFELCYKNPEYLAIGIHQYFAFKLFLGVGAGDWNKLVRYGSTPPDTWPLTLPQLAQNAQNAHIGRDVWLVEQLKAWKLWPLKLFNTEFGFDRIHNLPQMATLDGMAGRTVRGIQTLMDLLANDNPSMHPEQYAAQMITWFCSVMPYVSAPCFYNWSIEPSWSDYNIAPLHRFKDAIIAYNRAVRSSTPPPPVEPPAPLTLEQRVEALERRLDAIEKR